MSLLAIHGGEPIRKNLFPKYKTICDEEKEAVSRVMDSGILSQYLGQWHQNFYGGTEVQALEKEWANYFGVKYAIAVNSATSGLYAAVGATGIEPGEEVIVTPYTMTASAVAPLIYQAIPIFADIEEEYYCLDPQSVREKVTSKTRAIIVVNLFGLPYDIDAINGIAQKHGILVIEDNAQAPGSLYQGKYTGTFGDIGVFSLNYHKHIHCGEGGIIVTDREDLAEKMYLIRNHAEAIAEDKGVSDLVNMLGFNYRMTELSAAIARCQLKKLKNFVQKRQKNCEYIAKKLQEIPPIIPSKIRKECTHSYYLHPFRFFQDSEILITRDIFISAVKAELTPTEHRENEGTLLDCGYCKPLYLQPLYQKKIAYGSKHFPFSLYSGQLNYKYGICPIAEKMYYKEHFSHDMMHPQMNPEDLDDVVKAFYKVWENKHLLIS